jgi:predicted PurR-regulated permease PerM
MPDVSDPVSAAMTTPRERRPRWLGVLLGLVLVGFLIWAHAVVLAPFVLSVALAYVLEPSVTWLTRRRVPRPLSASLCLLAVVLVGLLLLTWLVPIVVDLAPKLQTQLPELAEGAWHWLAPRLGQFGFKAPAELNDLRPLLIKLFSTHGEQWTQALLSSARVGGSWALTLSGLALLVPMLAFYWLLDWARLMAGARQLLPYRWRRRTLALVAEADGMLGQYLRGQLVVMLVLAIYYSVGLMLCGFDLALPIGVFTGLAVFIPYLGFGLGLILALLSGVLQFAADPAGLWWPLMAVAGVYGAGQVFESFLLTPRLVGERIGLHPAGVILALMLFGYWLGFAGLLMALPVSALAMVLIRHAVAVYKASEFYQEGRDD